MVDTIFLFLFKLFRRCLAKIAKPALFFSYSNNFFPRCEFQVRLTLAFKLIQHKKAGTNYLHRLHLKFFPFRLPVPATSAREQTWALRPLAYLPLAHF